MGNTKSEPKEPTRRENNIVSLNEIIRAQGTIISQLRQDIEKAESDLVPFQRIILAQKTSIQQLKEEIRKAESDLVPLQRIILAQNTSIQQLKEEIRAQPEAEQTVTDTRETQTDQDDVDHLRTLQYRTPNISSNVEYSHHVMDTWFSVAIHRSNHGGPPGQTNASVIHVLNASKRIWSYGPMNIVPPSLNQLRTGEKLYYHGSNDHNVKSILEHGIDITKSTRATDFSCGGGFYVTKNLGKAVEWSNRVVGWKGGRPAVVAFKISQTLRKEEPHLSLKVNSTTNRKWWECVVSHFRHSGMSRDVGNVLKNVKFIKGPVANNKTVGYDEIPRPYFFTQLCIRDQQYAVRFGSLENISFVIFAV